MIYDDNAGTEIRATFFKEACTKFFPIIEEGKASVLPVYMICIYMVYVVYMI